MIKTQKVPLWQRIVPRILQTIAWYPTRPLLNFFMRMKISGKENMKEAFKLSKETKRPILVAPTHTTEFDPIISLNATIPPHHRNFPMFWVARPGHTYKGDPDFGWRKFIYGTLFFLSWGAQPTVMGAKDYAESLKRHVWLLKKGYTVCIFPQGGMGKKDARGGIGYLIEATDPVVVPLKIEGIDKINNKEFWGRKRHLKVTICKPKTKNDIINPELPVPERYKDASASIVSLFDQI